jgi:hypothetical protein
MMFALLLWSLLGQDPAECRLRTPGLHCFESARTPKGVTCRAICAYGKVGADGGTSDRRNVFQDEPVADDATCRAKLAERCR